ncbi:unnamed protein product [Boreogadus saida]
MNEPVSMKENKDQRDLTTGGGNPFSGFPNGKTLRMSQYSQFPRSISPSEPDLQSLKEQMEQSESWNGECADVRSSRWPPPPFPNQRDGPPPEEHCSASSFFLSTPPPSQPSDGGPPDPRPPRPPELRALACLSPNQRSRWRRERPHSQAPLRTDALDSVISGCSCSYRATGSTA